MKAIVCSLLILLVIGCSATKNSGTSPTTTSLSVAQKSIAHLASDKMAGRVIGTDGIENAARFIEKEFEQTGVEFFFKETYRDIFYIDQIETYNIVGVINSKKESDEYIILSAHYDHIDNGASIKGDSIYNGANDNASGVVTVLEIAKLLKKHTDVIQKNVLIVLFSGEESGLKGAEHLARKLTTERTKLTYLINFEMVGVPLHVGRNKAFITGYKLSTMQQKLNEALDQEFIVYNSNAEKYNLFTRSDNYPFYQQFGIPAQTISTFAFKNYDYYHHVDDEVQALDYNHIDSIINLSGKAILYLLQHNIEIKMVDE